MTDDQARPMFERFRDGWVMVDRDGHIATLSPLSEETARGFARILGVDFPWGVRASDDPDDHA